MYVLGGRRFLTLHADLFRRLSFRELVFCCGGRPKKEVRVEVKYAVRRARHDPVGTMRVNGSLTYVRGFRAVERTYWYDIPGTPVATLAVDTIISV